MISLIRTTGMAIQNPQQATNQGGSQTVDGHTTTKSLDKASPKMSGPAAVAGDHIPKADMDFHRPEGKGHSDQLNVTAEPAEPKHGYFTRDDPPPPYNDPDGGNGVDVLG